MSYSGSEVWAGDSRGMLHSFSMQSGTLKALSQFDVGHTAMVTGIHRSPGSLYTCSSDKTVKVHIPCSPPRTLCTLQSQVGVNGLSVEAGVLAVASGETFIEVWRPRKWQRDMQVSQGFLFLSSFIFACSKTTQTDTITKFFLSPSTYSWHGCK